MNKLQRIAIINTDRCKPEKCGLECKRSCPVVTMGKLCIQVKKTDKNAIISEELCTGCGICIKKCPFKAIEIINLPSNLQKDTIHRFNSNSFKLHRLPVPKIGQVLGLIGTNGIGKSTALKILAGYIKPNFGNYDNITTYDDILNNFKGNELYNYFLKMKQNKLKTVIKPQYVDQIKDNFTGLIKDFIKDETIDYLDMKNIYNKEIKYLSGGELQRFAISYISMCDADVYIFDEPTSFLDIKQRLNSAKMIRSLISDTKYIIVVEHDLAVLDYLSDYICCLYGKPGIYGVITLPYSVREGINVFLSGFIPTENLRFRNDSLTFNISECVDDTIISDNSNIVYPNITKTLGDFKLTINAGEFKNSEIIVLLGENGTGKSTFINILSNKLQPDDENIELPKLKVSYKKQTLNPKFNGTVTELLNGIFGNIYKQPQFNSDVYKPLAIEELMNRDVQTLSGGELQRIAIVLCLGTPADIYLIDEPSAFLDCEQRIIVSKIIKRFIMHNKKCAFIVEHDFIMATYLADKVIVYEGNPGKDCIANSPQSLLSGMNKFLMSLNITFRRDPINYRPRVNKQDSVKDQEQKKSGNYFYMND